MHDAQPDPRHHRALLHGALAWCAFSIVAVAVRGVRWEETYEHALLITRTVPYPEGHPLFIYCRNVFSGQSYLAALLLWLVDAPLLINGFWNVLQLALATVPVYLIAAHVGGRPWHGHIAVPFVLLGVHQAFQSYYPIETWPHFYAVGQIGAGYALLILALLLHGYWRIGWLLLGLMPALHLGQVPAIAAVAGLQWLHALFRGDRQRVRQALAYGALGFAPCILFFFIHRHFAVPLPGEGPYAAEGDARVIWAAYSALHDIHRNLPRLNPFWKSALGAGLALLLAGGAALLARDNRKAPFAGLTAYTAITCATVGSIWMIQQLMGPRMPFLLIGWMPHRLFNHLAVLLVPLTVGMLLRGRMAAGACDSGGMEGMGRSVIPANAGIQQRDRANLRIPLDSRLRGNDASDSSFPRKRESSSANLQIDDAHGISPFAGTLLLALMLIYAALYPLWAAILREDLFTRYAGNPEALIFALCGAAFVVWARAPIAPRWPILVGSAMTGLLAAMYPFGLAAAAAGAAAWLALHAVQRHASTRVHRTTGPALAAAGALLVASLLVQQGRNRENLALHPLQAEVTRYLAGRGESDAMLLTPYWDIGWLGKTHHSIFADYQTAHLMTYIPALAPALKKMHQDVFGFTLDGESGPPLGPWPDRTQEQWRRLANDYGFDYVLAPNEWTLQLERVLASKPYDLYRITP